MTQKIIVTEQDRLDAESFLEQYLREKVPGGDFSRGSALRDLVIGSMAYTFAYLQKENDIIRARQSLLLLGKLVDTDVDDAVNEILSNWFIKRKPGAYARGVAHVYFTQAGTVVIPKNTKFYRDSSTLFYPDTTQSQLAFDASELSPVFDATGNVSYYELSVPLVASLPGVGFNIEPGTFSNYTKFSPYVSRVENLNTFSGGGDIESTEDMLTRSETAITVRDLNSARSIDAVLKDNFATIDDVMVIGYGQPEMVRDLVSEISLRTKMHIGGHTDAFLKTPIVEAKTFTGTVGGSFTDTHEVVTILRDDTIADFAANNVVVGDMIVFYGATSSAETDIYVVKEVDARGVYVSSRTPFPKLLPEVEVHVEDGVIGAAHLGVIQLTTASYAFKNADVGKWIRIAGHGVYPISYVANGYARINTFTFIPPAQGQTFELCTRVVEYSIGDNDPNYANKVSRRITGRFTREMQHDGRILLPSEPIYHIRDVSFASNDFPSSITTDGRVVFLDRVNQEPAYPSDGQLPVGLDGTKLQYNVICRNPEESSSGWQMMELDIGWAGDKSYFNNQRLRVTYDTVTDYETVWAFMMDSDRRIECGSVIPRGFHPVYVRFDLSNPIKYRISRVATSGLDTTAAAQQLAEYINTFPVIGELDASDIIAFLRETFPVIGYIEPFTIRYQLLAPDGRVIDYATQDQVVVAVAKHFYPTDPTKCLADPEGLGVSQNTIRCLTLPEMIVLEALA